MKDCVLSQPVGSADAPAASAKRRGGAGGLRDEQKRAGKRFWHRARDVARQTNYWAPGSFKGSLTASKVLNSTAQG